MGKLICKIGYLRRNYNASIELYDEVVVATSKTLEGVKSEIIFALEKSKYSYLSNSKIQSSRVHNGYKLTYQLEISALLQSLGCMVTRSAISRITGINERQLGNYATGVIIPRPLQQKRIINGIHRIGQELLSVKID